MSLTASLIEPEWLKTLPTHDPNEYYKLGQAATVFWDHRKLVDNFRTLQIEYFKVKEHASTREILLSQQKAATEALSKKYHKLSEGYQELKQELDGQERLTAMEKERAEQYRRCYEGQKVETSECEEARVASEEIEADSVGKANALQHKLNAASKTIAELQSQLKESEEARLWAEEKEETARIEKIKAQEKLKRSEAYNWHQKYNEVNAKMIMMNAEIDKHRTEALTTKQEACNMEVLQQWSKAWNMELKSRKRMVAAHKIQMWWRWIYCEGWALQQVNNLRDAMNRDAYKRGFKAGSDRQGQIYRDELAGLRRQEKEAREMMQSYQRVAKEREIALEKGQQPRVKMLQEEMEQREAEWKEERKGWDGRPAIDALYDRIKVQEAQHAMEMNGLKRKVEQAETASRGWMNKARDHERELKKMVERDRLEAIKRQASAQPGGLVHRSIWTASGQPKPVRAEPPKPLPVPEESEEEGEEEDEWEGEEEVDSEDSEQDGVLVCPEGMSES